MWFKEDPREILHNNNGTDIIIFMKGAGYNYTCTTAQIYTDSDYSISLNDESFKCIDTADKWPENWYWHHIPDIKPYNEKAQDVFLTDQELCLIKLLYSNYITSSYDGDKTEKQILSVLGGDALSVARALVWLEDPTSRIFKYIDWFLKEEF